MAEMTSPIVTKITTTYTDEDLFNNHDLISIFPYIADGGVSLTGKLTLLFDGANKVMINNDGRYNDLIADSVWDSGDKILSISSIVVKNPCTLTLVLDK